MARVEVQTEDGEIEVALLLTAEEVKLVVSTWDIPLDLKQKLTEANRHAELLK